MTFTEAKIALIAHNTTNILTIWSWHFQTPSQAQARLLYSTPLHRHYTIHKLATCVDTLITICSPMLWNLRISVSTATIIYANQVNYSSYHEPSTFSNVQQATGIKGD